MRTVKQRPKFPVIMGMGILNRSGSPSSPDRLLSAVRSRGGYYAVFALLIGDMGSCVAVAYMAVLVVLCVV